MILWDQKKIHKNYINPEKNFQLQNINFENIFLTMRIWLENVFGLIKVIKPLPKTFLQRYYYELFFIIHKIFLKIVKKRISTHLLYWPQITMGWVLMIRKVLPSKSMSSEEYFEYPSYCHIFNRSEVTPSFQ